MLRIATTALGAAVSVTAMQTSTKQIVNIGPPPVGPYSVAVKAGGLVYVSGTLAQDDKGDLVGADTAAQTRRILDRMQGVLEAAGSSMPHVVAVTVYLKNAADFPAMNDAYRTYWPKDPPTRTTVITDLLLGALVEISMVAVPNGAERVVIHPKDWVASPNPYSYAIKSGDTLFLSGLVPRNGRDNSVVTGDITAQTKAVLDNAGELLRAAGMDHSNIVSGRVYLPNGADFQAMNATYRTYFKQNPPARATVVAGLAGKGYAVEMTFVASSSPRQVVGNATNPNLSPAIRAGNRLYVSGMLGNNADNAGNAAAQTKETLARIRATLEAGGYTPADVVDSLVYLTDLSKFQEMNAEYRPFFGKEFPARATVGTGLVSPGGVVEIMVTAVKP
jgi:2-iminobutanoate/2-iminopropanoate deaminase